jgi:hypothetical protein
MNEVNRDDLRIADVLAEARTEQLLHTSLRALRFTALTALAHRCHITTALMK